MTSKTNHNCGKYVRILNILNKIWTLVQSYTLICYHTESYHTFIVHVYIIVGSKAFSQQLKDMKVPVKYHKFQNLLLQKVTRISKHEDDGPPILTWNQMLM